MTDAEIEKKFLKLWQGFLIDAETNETAIAKNIGTVQQNLNQKIRKHSLRVTDLIGIADKYGYSVRIEKD